MNFVSAIFSAISSVFSWLKSRSDLNNQEKITKAKENVEEEQAKDSINKAIAERDTDEIRKQLSN